MSGREVIIRTGPQRLPDVIFTPRATSVPTPFQHHSTGREDATHVATDDTTRQAHIRDRLLRMIRGARDKVFFCSFLFADESIVDALCDAAERLHGGVYVLTALGKHLRAEVLELDAEVDASTAMHQDRARSHEKHLQRLAYAGVWLRSAEDCHAKFCVADDRICMVTSANATQAAYESNPEDGIELGDPSVAREFGRLFAHVWQHLTTLESTPGAQLDVHSLPPRRSPRWQPLGGDGSITPVATVRDLEASLLRAAVEVIDCATSRLTIATYSLMDIEDHPLGHALERATRRGVTIDVLLQPRNHVAAQRATCAWLVSLAPERVRLHGHRRTHTKSIVADGRRALVWTGNLEANHGWRDGLEVGLDIHDDGVAGAIESWVRDVTRRSTHEALLAPSADELVAHGHPLRLSGAWSLALPDGAPVERIVEALRRVPIEVIEHREGRSLLCAGELLIDVEIDDPSRSLRGTRVRQPEGIGGARSAGWAADCTLRITAADGGSREARPPRRGRRR